MNEFLRGVLMMVTVLTPGLQDIDSVSLVGQKESPQRPQSNVGPRPRGLHLTLTRDYGNFEFRQCRVHVGIYEGSGVTDLWCDSPLITNFAPLTARTKLTAEEVNR
jgi:hypothetical protein